MASFIPDDYLSQADQNQIDQILAEQAQARQMHNTLTELLNRESIVSKEADEQRKRAAIAEQQNRLRMSQENQKNIDSEIDARIQGIIEDRTIYDGNSILSRINQDELLSQYFQTDKSKIKLIQDIQSQKRRIANQGTALEGYTIDPEKEEGMWETFKQTGLDTLANFRYKTEKIATLRQLNNLPSKDLRAIHQKKELARNIEDKLYSASQGLSALSTADRAKSLNQVQYYQNELNKLQLSPEEQKLWDQYGNEYLRLNGELDVINHAQEEFTGSNVLSPEEARTKMKEYATKYAFSINGNDSYFNPDYAWEVIKNKFDIGGRAFSDELAKVAASAIPFMLTGIPGLIAKGAALSSDFLGYFADSLEAYYRKNGENGFEDSIKSAIGAAASTTIDFYGMHLLTKALPKSGLIREQQRAFKEAFDNNKNLLKVNPKSAFYAIAVQTQQNMAKNISESTSKAVIDSAEKAVNKAITGKTAGTIERSWEGLKGANEYLHRYFNIGLQDIAKAGGGLALENVGASAVQSKARGEEIDPESLVESAMSGLIGGGMFHGVSAPGHVGVHHLKDLYKKYKGTYGIDTNADFNAAIDAISEFKDSDEAKEFTDAYKEQIAKTKNALTESLDDLKNTAANKFSGLGTFSLNKETGKWEFTPTDKATFTNKAVAQRYVHGLNNIQKKVNQYVPILEKRIKALDNVQETKEKNDYAEAIKPNSSFDEEKRDRILSNRFERLLNNGDSAGISQFLQDTQKMDKTVADKAAANIIAMPEKNASLEEMADESDKDFFNTYKLINPEATGIDANSFMDLDENAEGLKEEDKTAKKNIKDAVVKGDYAAFTKALDSDSTLSTARKDQLKSIFSKDRLDDIAERLEEAERASKDNVADVSKNPDKVGTVGKNGERKASYSSYSKKAREYLKADIADEIKQYEQSKGTYEISSDINKKAKELRGTDTEHERSITVTPKLEDLPINHIDDWTGPKDKYGYPASKEFTFKPVHKNADGTVDEKAVKENDKIAHDAAMYALGVTYDSGYIEKVEGFNKANKKQRILEEIEKNSDVSFDTLKRKEGLSEEDRKLYEEIEKELQEQGRIVKEKPLFATKYKTKEEAEKELENKRNKAKEKKKSFAYKVQGNKRYGYYLIDTLKGKTDLFNDLVSIGRDDSKSLSDLLKWWEDNRAKLKDVSIGDETLEQVINRIVEPAKRVKDTSKDKEVKKALIDAMSLVTSQTLLDTISETGTEHRYSSPISRAQRRIMSKKAEDAAKADERAANKTSKSVSSKSWEDINADVKQAYIQIINSLFPNVALADFNNDKLSLTDIDQKLANIDVKFNQWDSFLLEEYRKKINTTTIDAEVKKELLEEITTLQALIQKIGVTQDTNSTTPRVLSVTGYKGNLWENQEDNINKVKKIRGLIRFFKNAQIVPNQDVDFLEGSWSGTKTEIAKTELYKMKAQVELKLEALLTTEENISAIQDIYQELANESIKSKDASVETTNLLTFIADELHLSEQDRNQLLHYAEVDTNDASFTHKDKVDFVNNFLNVLCTSTIFQEYMGFLHSTNPDAEFGTSSRRPKGINTWEEFNDVSVTKDISKGRSNSIQVNLANLDKKFNASGSFIIHMLDKYDNKLINASVKETAIYSTLAENTSIKDIVDIPKGDEFKNARSVLNDIQKSINAEIVGLADLDIIIGFFESIINNPNTKAIERLDEIFNISNAKKNKEAQAKYDEEIKSNEDSIYIDPKKANRDTFDNIKKDYKDIIKDSINNLPGHKEAIEAIKTKYSVADNIVQDEKGNLIITNAADVAKAKQSIKDETNKLIGKWLNDSDDIHVTVHGLARSMSTVPQVQKSQTLTSIFNKHPNISDKERMYLNAIMPKLVAVALKKSILNKKIDLSDLETRNKAIKAFKLFDVYGSSNALDYTAHTHVDVDSVSSNNVPQLVEVLAKNDKTFNEVLSWLNEDTNRADLEGRSITTQDISELKKYLRNNGFFKLNAIKDFIKNNPEIGNRLAKTLQAYINNAVNKDNTVGLYNTVGLATSGKQQLNGTSNTSNIKSSITRSQYSEDIKFNPNAVSVLGSNNFATTGLALNADYACSSELASFFKLLEIVKDNAGYFSNSKGNLADEIFGSFINGAFTYNEEILNIMAGVGIFHMSTITGKQSEDYINSLKDTGRFTEKAANSFISHKFVDTATLAYDMGTQIASEAGIRKGGTNARAAVMPRLVTALGGRAYGLLEKAGYIEKYYFNVKTGAFKKSVTDAELRTNQWQRVTMITPKGENLQTKLKDLTKVRLDANNKRHHLNTDLFNYDKDITYRTNKEYKEYQKERLSSDFGLDVDIPLNKITLPSEIVAIKGKDAKGIEYDILINNEKETVAVNLQTDSAKTPNWVFLPRSSYMKKDETSMSPSRLIEIAWQWDTEWEVDVERITTELDFLKGVNSLADLKTKFSEDDLKAIYKLLDMKWNKHSGLYKARDEADNIAKFNQWKDLYEEVVSLNAPGSTIKLHFPMTNTVNNRVYVQSPKINNREFKASRNFFRPAGHANADLAVPANNDIPAGRNETQNNILKAIVLANFGFDTDKVSLEGIGEVFDKLVEITDFQDLVAKADKVSAIELAKGLIDLENNTDVTGILFDSTKQASSPLEIEVSTEAISALKELNRDNNLEKIKNNEAITDFKLRMEIDGLTNGTSIHLATSGALGNVDSYTYAMLLGVGIFTKPYDNEKGTVRDYVSTKLNDRENVFDTYEAAGNEALNMAVDNIIEEVAKGLESADPRIRKLAQTIHYVGKTFYKAETLRASIRALFERNIIKYVTMPNSYGAGRKALIAYLLDEFSKKISEVVAKNIDNNSASVVKMYEYLSDLNGSNIILRDVDNNTITFNPRTMAEDKLTLSSYSFVAEDNTGISSVMTDYIFSYAAKATEKRMQLAKNHSTVLMEAVENTANFFNLAIAETLTSDKWKDKKLEDLTNQDIQSITEDIGVVLHIDADNTSLNALKNATISAIELVKLYQKVPSYFNDGSAGLILNSKSTLTKESIATALSPEFNHGRDSGIINRCQSSIRQSLGEFLGIHDAGIVNFAQIADRANNVGTASNEQFVENTVFTYRPLIELLRKLQNEFSYLTNNPDLDKNGIFTTKIKKSIDDLTILIQEQVAGRLFRLKEVEKGNHLGINQYAFNNQSGIVLKADGVYVDNGNTLVQGSLGATKLLEQINDDMKDINMVVSGSSEIAGLATYLHREVPDLYSVIKDKFSTYTTLDKFEHSMINGALKLDNTQRANLKYYIEKYKKYIKGQYNESFFDSIYHAQNAREQENNKIVNEFNSANSIRDTLTAPTMQLKLLMQLSDMMQSIGAFGENGESNNTVFNRMFMQKAIKLSHRMSTDYGAWSTLNNMVAMFTNDNTTSLDILHQMMAELNYENKDEALNIVDLASLEGANVVEVDVGNGVSLDALLDDFNAKSFALTGLNPLEEHESQKSRQVLPSQFLESYIDRYLKRLEAAIPKNATQKDKAIFTFKMDNALSRILFAAVNSKINEGKEWANVSLAIIPPFTDKANLDVNKNVCLTNLVKKKASTFNAVSFVLSNQEKDLEHLNYLYNNQFVPESIRAGITYKSKFNVARDPTKVSADTESNLTLKQSNDSYIFTGNNVGWLNDAQRDSEDNIKSAADIVITEAYLYTGEKAQDFTDNDLAARNFDALSDDKELYAEVDKYNVYSFENDASKVIDGKTGEWENEITEDTMLAIPVASSDLSIDNPVANGLINNIAPFAKAYAQAKRIHDERVRLYENGVYKYRESAHAPITIRDVYYKGTRVHLRFQVSKDNEISVAEIAPWITLAPNLLKYGKQVYILKPDTPTRIRDKFAYTAEGLFNASISDKRPDGINKFFRNVMYQANMPNAEKRYVAIPERIFNRNNRISMYVSEESASNNDINRISAQNLITNASTNETIMYFGEEANPSRIFTESSNNSIIAFSEEDNTKDIINGVINKFNTGFDAKVIERKSNQVGISHGYGVKPVEQMTRQEYELYKDTSCKQLRDTAKNLDASDRANGFDNSLVNRTIAKVLDANVIVRLYLNEQMGRDGKSTLNTLRNTKVGFVQVGLVKDGSASNTETFGHELAHIPVEFLKADPNAYKQLTDLYNFVAKHITWDDFTYQDAEDKRIFDYIFNNPNTVEAESEFLVYAVTNQRFRDALDNVSKHAKVKEEFDSRLNGIMNKLLDKLNPYNEKPPVNINQICGLIFNKSIELTKAYYHEHATVPDEAYQRETTKLESINQKIVETTASFAETVTTWINAHTNSNHNPKSVGNAIRRVWSNTNPYTSTLYTSGLDRGQIAKGRMTELMPVLVDNIDKIKWIKSDLANELKQSFEGVSVNNWEYVKLRIAAKDQVDKAREQGASAVNKVVAELTKDIDTKTANNLSEYVIHTDMQCLLDSNRDIKDVVKLMSDKRARYDEIKRIESRLSKEPYGQYYINASRGLANKLVHGVNTSGIGYNNAYEIANFCGTKFETNDSPHTQEIDQLVTLYAMHELNKAKPSVYSNMTKHTEALEGLLVLHGNLIQNERTEVYSDSNQYWHIPKGELHGGKVNNRYEIIPEEQLKAYQWTGYRKIKDIKLDKFYSNYVNGHKYVAVGAKYMPDIPYTDGIPVLTDIYNGRNKANIYLDNILIDDMHVSPTWNENVVYQLDSYMASQIKALNSDKFVQNDYKKIDGVFTPTYGLVAGMSGATFAINEKEKDNYLAKNHKITAVLGDHYGSIIERSKAPEWNTKVAESLDEIYNARKDKHDFTWLKENEEDPEKLKMYKLLPYEIKEYFKEKYQDRGVPIETRYITGILGYKSASASNPESNVKYYSELRHTYTDYIDHLLHSAPVAYGESLAQYLTRVGKENLVIKGMAVSINNIISNNVTLGLHGMTPQQVCKYQTEGLKAYNAYRELALEKAYLDVKYLVNDYTSQDAARYRVIESSMHNNPISYLAEHGAIPQIAEDLTESDRLSKDLIDKYIPKGLQGITHNAVGDQKSFLYGRLHDLATNGDIVGKYALFKHLTENNGINKDEALRQAVQTFVDYSNPLPRNIDYLDNIGALPFTKFLFGVQTNIINSFTKNPAGSLSWIGANSFMGLSDIYSSMLGFDSITNRWQMPGFGLWYSSLDQVPSMRIINALSSL